MSSTRISDKLAEDFETEVRAGNIPGYELISRTAQSALVGNTYADLWSNAADMVYATVDDSWEIVSSDANDTLLGTGARTATVTWVDSNFIEYKEDFDLNGGTIVLSGGARFYDIVDFRVASSGTIRGLNIGVLTLQVAAGGNVRGVIIAQAGHAFNSHITVPAGKYMLPIATHRWSAKGADIFIKFLIQHGGVGVFEESVITINYQSSSEIKLFTHPLEAGTRVLQQAKASAANQFASMNINYYFVDEDIITLL